MPEKLRNIFLELNNKDATPTLQKQFRIQPFYVLPEIISNNRINRPFPVPVCLASNDLCALPLSYLYGRSKFRVRTFYRLPFRLFLFAVGTCSPSRE